MSLINCPECSEKISDKSDICIHCGYPLNNNICIINGVEYNLKDELNMSLSGNDDPVKAIGSLRRKTSLGLSDGCRLIEIMREQKSVPKTFIPEYPLQEVESQNEHKSAKCPYCHSSDTKKITNTSKAVHTALFGIFSISRNSKNYHCNKCGSNF